MSETATALATTAGDEVNPEPPDSPNSEKSSEREYHVFKLVQPDVFQKVKTVVATSPQNALKTVDVKTLQEVEHIACTARSWYAPGKPTVDTRTTLKFGS